MTTPTMPTIDPPDRANRPSAEADSIIILPNDPEKDGETKLAPAAGALSGIAARTWKRICDRLVDGWARFLATFRRANGSGKRRVLVVVGLSAAVVTLVVAETLLGAVLQARSQQVLASEFAATLDRAAGAAGAGDLSPLPVDAPAYGSAVALISIPALGLQQIVVEGQAAEYTQQGPGHVPGTSMPGQPGNAAIVGRRATFGAPFGALPALVVGDPITVTTVEGSTQYRVTEVNAKNDPFAATEDSRLTLVTSAPPVLATEDYSVTAGLVGRPLPPTPQNPRTYQSARDGSFANWAQLIVWSALAVGVIALAWLGYRRLRLRAGVIWLITVPVTCALLILILRNLDSFFPATL